MKPKENTSLKTTTVYEPDLGRQKAEAMFRPATPQWYWCIYLVVLCPNRPAVEGCVIGDGIQFLRKVFLGPKIYHKT